MPRFNVYPALAFAIVAMFAALVLAATPARSASLSPRMVVDTLLPSLVHLVRGGRDICTAFKVAPATYLTAKHCAAKDVSRDFLRVGQRYRFVEQYITSDAPRDDWAIVMTGYDNPRLRPLRAGCLEEVYLGMPVAYAGYPEPLRLTMVIGRIISAVPPLSPFSRSKFLMDAATNRGASGSPIISLNSGNVIGILIEAIGSEISPGYVTGIESIKNTSLCREVATTVSGYQ